jgi:hypothetical protein
MSPAFSEHQGAHGFCAVEGFFRFFLGRFYFPIPLSQTLMATRMHPFALASRIPLFFCKAVGMV